MHALLLLRGLGGIHLELSRGGPHDGDIMVRDNPRRPETNAGAQWPDLRALSLMDDPAARQSPASHAERFTVPGNGRPGFPDCVYLLAAAVFRKYHQQKPASHRLVNYGKQEGSALPEVKEGGTEVTEAYELALNTLKCKP